MEICYQQIFLQLSTVMGNENELRIVLAKILSVPKMARCSLAMA
jgi:hypothetical protein